MRAKLSPQQRARLGGLARAQKLSGEQRSLVAQKGGLAFMERYGMEGIVRMRYGLKVKR